MTEAPRHLLIHAPAGVESRPQALRLARTRLNQAGWSVTLDASVKARHQRFAGDDEARLASLYRVADASPSVAMACRGGYGMTRLLDRIDWRRIARSVSQGTRWVGFSDLTALQLGLLAHTGAGSWHGPMAADDFGRAEAAGGLDEITRDCFEEAMDGSLEAVGFRTDPGFDGLDLKGTLWGGNLTMVLSLLGTPHWPKVRGGILFLEDVAEHPYRVERALLQLKQAGVLERQKAVLLGHFSHWKPAPLDRGYGLRQAIARVRQDCSVPMLTGLPFGHVPTKVCLPQGRRVQLVVSGRDALIGW